MSVSSKTNNDVEVCEEEEEEVKHVEQATTTIMTKIHRRKKSLNSQSFCFAPSFAHRSTSNICFPLTHIFELNLLFSSSRRLVTS
jgi:subtilase family serine protease